MFIPDVPAGVPASLLDYLPIALVVTDAAETMIHVNRHYRRMLGIPDEVPLLGRPARDTLAYLLATFEDAAAVGRAIEEATAGGRDLLGLPVRLRDGRTMARDAVRLPDGGWVVTYRDISAEEHARAQELLARQETASIARIPTENPDPIARLTADGAVLFANPAAERLLAEAPPAELPDLCARIRRIVALSLRYARQMRLRLRFGERWYDTFAAPFPADGYVNLYFVDSTARRQAEAETRRQRAFYEAILDYLPADVFVLDPDLRYRYLNPQALRDPEHRAWIIGRDDLEYAAHRGYSRSAAERRQTVLQRALTDGRQVSWEEQVKRPGGRGKQYLACFAQPVYDEAGAPTMLIGYGLDVTASREAQLTMQRSEKQYRDLLTYTQALICTHDLAGVVLSVNPALAALVGLPAPELVGRNLIELVPAADRAAARAYVRQFSEEIEATASGVMRVLPHHATAPRYLLYHNVRVDEPGQPPYVIGYAQDISERIQAERATQRAKEAAEAAAYARETFLANMSHEIRTPLNGVLGMAALLAKTTLDPHQRELLGVVRRSGQHLLGVINDVLDLAKITSEKLELSPTSFNLCEALSTTLEPLVLQAQEKGITVEGRRLRDSCPYPWVWGDAQRIAQILLNLTSNALKFTPAGGTIRVAADLVAETAETLTVAFSVGDTGIGISPEHQERIFQPFSQAYTDISRTFGGTGLGLSISRALVEQMGGTLHLESAPGQGSTFSFTLTLPRAAVVPTATEPDAAAAEAAAGPTTAIAGPTTAIAGLRVLLAEDNEVNRLLARMLLTHHGIRVTEATTGTEAVALARAEPFDVVLMDIQMPEMSGVEATVAIRALPDPARARVPIIALTANAFRSDTERYLAAGMDGCLTKPFEEAELLRLLTELTGGSPTTPDAQPPGAPGSSPAHAVKAPGWSPVLPGAALPQSFLPSEENASAEPVFPATALRLGHGNPEFVRRAVAEFLATAPTLLERIRGASAADGAAVVAIAHQLVPSARTFDAPVAAAALADLELLPPTDPDWPDVRDYAAQELDDLLTLLREWMKM